MEILVDWKIFFDRLARERDLCGLTDQSLSTAAGLSKDGIRNWRRTVARNPNGGPNLTSVMKVANALNVHVAYLIGETDLPNSDKLVKSDVIAWRRNTPIDAPFSWHDISFESIREDNARILVGSDHERLQVLAKVEKSGIGTLLEKIEEASKRLR